MTTGNTDIDTIASEPTPLTLESGLEIKIQRLKMRQLMALLKILTRGASEVLATLSFNAESSQEEFTGQLIGATILAIPEAEEETVEFIQRMVSPAGIKEGRLSKADIQRNVELEQQLRAELDNPELTDLVVIVSEIITAEAPHIRALGNQLGVLLKAFRTSETAKQSASSESASKA
jgi:Holliday junction resolvasome RuvABC endonuclease subunit